MRNLHTLAQTMLHTRDDDVAALAQGYLDLAAATTPLLASRIAVVDVAYDLVTSMHEALQRTAHALDEVLKDEAHAPS